MHVWVADAVLRNRSHLSRHPTGQDLPSLLLAQTRTVKVSFVYKSDNVDDKLVFVENGVDNDGDHGGEEISAKDLDDNDDQAACLEDGTVDQVLASFH